MLTYNWPGNIRELRNSVERAYVLANGDLAEPEDLALANLDLGLTPANAPQAYREQSLEDLEQFPRFEICDPERVHVANLPANVDGLHVIDADEIVKARLVRDEVLAGE